MLGALKDGPGLSLFDDKGVGRAVLGGGRTVFPDGRQIRYPESSLMLFGPDGNGLWQAL